MTRKRHRSRDRRRSSPRRRSVSPGTSYHTSKTRHIGHRDTSKSRRYNDRFDEVRHENTKRTDGYQKYHKRRNSCDHEDRYNRHKHKKEDSQNREDHREKMRDGRDDGRNVNSRESKKLKRTLEGQEIELDTSIINNKPKVKQSSVKREERIDRGFAKKSDESHVNERKAAYNEEDKFGKYLRGDYDKQVQKPEKEKPNFEPSGKLVEDTNTYRGVVIKYNEPADAHMPKVRWRLYPFKGDQSLQVLYIHRQSAYLIGRDRKIADLPVDHPSCSKQHAVFQYRLTALDLPDGTTVKRVRPYIIDLGSANGTFLNDERIEPQRYVELREKDVLKFGYSSREFVLLNEKSYDSENTSSKEMPIKEETSS